MRADMYPFMMNAICWILREETFSKIILPYRPDHSYICSNPASSNGLVCTFSTWVCFKFFSYNSFSLFRDLAGCSNHIHINTSYNANPWLFIHCDNSFLLLIHVSLIERNALRIQ